MRRYVRDCLVACALVLAATITLPASHAASSYPERAIRLIMPFAAGGGGDIQIRLIAQHLSSALGQPVVVDNRPGAAGVIGWEILARAVPDGYTIGHGSTGLASVPNFSKVPFNPASDFSGISLISLGTNVLLVSAAVRAASVKELVELAKSRPGKLNCATAGSGSPMHLASILFNRLANTHIVDIQYKGGAPALTALLAQEVDVMFGALVQIMPVMASGKVRGIAVTTARRSALLPNTPTIAESGVPGYDFNAWTGIFAPKSTPAEIIRRLNAEIVQILDKTDVRKQLAEAEPASSTPGELQKILRNEVARWQALISAPGPTRRR